MKSSSTYSRHIGYPHDTIEQAKAIVAPLRTKVVRRRADDIVESQIKTLLANRLRNIEQPGSEEKMGLAIFGDSGAGKSSLVVNRVEKDPLLMSMTEGNPFGFVSVKFRSPVRIATAGHAVVKSLGLPGAVFSARRDYWDEVGSRVAELGTCVLHFDEVQDAFRQNRAVAHVWMQAFKALMNSAWPVVLILTGTTEMKPFFQNDDAQGPRRMIEIDLPPLTFTGGAKVLKHQMDAYCKMVGLENGLAGTDYERLMRAAAYQFGRTLTLGLNGIQEAIMAKSGRVDRVHLAHAFERDRPSTLPAHNFFWAPDYLRLSPFGKGHSGEPASTTRPKSSVPRKQTKW